MRHKWPIALGLVLLAAATAQMYSTAGLDKFDSTAWKAQHTNESFKNPRSGMIPALKKELRPGVTRADVEALLGEPEAREGNNRYHYWIGAGGFGVDFDEFVIEFDDADKLERYFVRRG
jgi:hypothetical protein